MSTVPKITLPGRLNHLVMSCQKMCVSECCGIAAFDFSPLHIASCISAYTGAITAEDIAEWELELRNLEEFTRYLTPNEEGYICEIAGMNQWFSRDSFNEFIAELRYNIRVSPEVLQLSDRLCYRRE